MPRKKKQTKQNQKGEGLYDKIANSVFGARLFDGEIHAPIYTKDGWKFGSYIGPGTEIMDRIRKGVKPVSKSDKVAQAHDLRYLAAKTPADVRAADLRMIEKLNSLQAEGKEYKFNVLMGKLPIKLKMWAEDEGIIKKGSFADFKGFANADDEAVARKKLKELDQKGYGKKNAWQKHVATVRKKHPNMSYKECLKLASKSYQKTSK